ncbi:MAG: hypothetical protein ACAI34_14445 [Verrucomicrobium sp.]|nr:hypothetical protein [Verrucomicrobium sp.]
MKRFAFALAASLPLVTHALAATPAQESDFYKIEPFSFPSDIVAEVGAIDLLPEQRLAVGTRRGDVFIVDGAFGNDPAAVKYTRFASGLHEILGLAWKDGWLYVTQRPEVSRLKDKDGDGRADIFETVNADWNITGDYHEYAFGSRFDPKGNLWVTLCLTGSFHSNAPFRGWCLQITPEGKMVPTAAGLRSPGGVGFAPDGITYYDDNQGVWNGSSALKPLLPGSFHGHSETLKWWDKNTLGDLPLESVSGTRIVQERERNPKFVPPAVILPHAKVGNSPTAWDWDESGKFGPFTKQLIIADQSFSVLNRVTLETVNGVKQGCVFPFLKGLQSGPIGVRMSTDGVLFVGGSDRGWGARGGKPFDLERIRWTGKTPFEMQDIKATPEGFEVQFTKPVDAATAGDAANYKMRAWTYIWQSSYGSPEVDEVLPKVEVAKVAEDGKSVQLKITPLTRGHVHQLDVPGVKSKDGEAVLHPVGYYTLNEIPKK